MNQVCSYTKLDYDVQMSLMKALKSIQTSGVEPETGFAVGLGRKTLTELCKEAYIVPSTPDLTLTSTTSYAF